MQNELAWVLNLMAVGGFRHVPIVDEHRRPVAVFSVKHIVERLVEFFPNDVLNLPPRPGKNIAHVREGVARRRRRAPPEKTITRRLPPQPSRCTESAERVARDRQPDWSYPGTTPAPRRPARQLTPRYRRG